MFKHSAALHKRFLLARPIMTEERTAHLRGLCERLNDLIWQLRDVHIELQRLVTPPTPEPGSHEFKDYPLEPEQIPQPNNESPWAAWFPHLRR